MLENSTVAFIGAGVMAEAIIRGLTDRKLIDPARIVAADIRPERGRELRERYGVGFSIDNRAALDGADTVVLSVKPQILPQVLPALSGGVPQDALVLSIIAGARIATLCDGLRHASVVRSMPNTPAQIGRGVTAWTASPAVTENQRAKAKELLGALGAEVYVEGENLLDAVTAVSGSGPAYAFLFMEALVDAGVGLGFEPDLAKQLVLQTVRGAAEYALGAESDLAQLRKQVASPGGTTEAALRSFERDEFRNVVRRAVQAAHQRSLELGSGPIPGSKPG
ncbi:MAG: pyrroline-5-carboxylate reductase [Anaerolineales bacterium]|nr:pyrroline-5-carboxylate reductase [Anaerolineales bacterium]